MSGKVGSKLNREREELNGLAEYVEEVFSFEHSKSGRKPLSLSLSLRICIL